MSETFLDGDVLRAFSTDDLLARRPFPWWSFHELLRPEAFARLHAAYPPLSLFEWHEDRARSYGQRPHNRYYLAYRSEKAPGYSGRPKSDFPEVWQEFLTELETSPTYRDFIQRTMGHTDLGVRYTFHVGVAGSEVSPHLDKSRKAGTHIFYFNTRDDWDPTWGGATLLLDGKRGDDPAPGFEDFATSERVENLGNYSFLFKNTEDAWHGVQAMTCPEGYYRRLFNVVLEIPDAAPSPPKASPLRRLKRRVRASVGSR